MHSTPGRSAGEVLLAASLALLALPVQVKATVVDATRIVFANPGNDAPRTIEYRREGDRLTVYLDAPASGAIPIFSFLRADVGAAPG